MWDQFAWRSKSRWIQAWSRFPKHAQPRSTNHQEPTETRISVCYSLNLTLGRVCIAKIADWSLPSIHWLPNLKVLSLFAQVTTVLSSGPSHLPFLCCVNPLKSHLILSTSACAHLSCFSSALIPLLSPLLFYSFLEYFLLRCILFLPFSFAAPFTSLCSCCSCACCCPFWPLLLGSPWTQSLWDDGHISSCCSFHPLCSSRSRKAD